MDHTLSSVTVLVVDDDPLVRSLLTDTLEMYGATVTAVETAQEALTTLAAWRPDVLLSDLQMPDKDGYWLIGQVRALPPEHGGMTPAACLTGVAEPEDRARLLRAGFQYHVAKPVQLVRLIGIVRSLASSHEAMSAPVLAARSRRTSPPSRRAESEATRGNLPRPGR